MQLFNVITVDRNSQSHLVHNKLTHTFSINSELLKLLHHEKVWPSPKKSHYKMSFLWVNAPASSQRDNETVWLCFITLIIVINPQTVRTLILHEDYTPNTIMLRVGEEMERQRMSLQYYVVVQTPLCPDFSTDTRATTQQRRSRLTFIGHNNLIFCHWFCFYTYSPPSLMLLG